MESYKIPSIKLEELAWKDIDSQYGSWSYVDREKMLKIKEQLIKLIERLK